MAAMVEGHGMAAGKNSAARQLLIKKGKRRRGELDGSPAVRRFGKRG
jgi:hypothetical protein